MQRQPEPPEDSAALQWATSLPLFGLPESFTDLRLVGDREVSRWEERAHGRVMGWYTEVRLGGLARAICRCYPARFQDLSRQPS